MWKCQHPLWMLFADTWRGWWPGGTDSRGGDAFIPVRGPNDTAPYAEELLPDCFFGGVGKPTAQARIPCAVGSSVAVFSMNRLHRAAVRSPSARCSLLLARNRVRERCPAPEREPHRSRSLLRGKRVLAISKCSRAFCSSPRISWI